MKVRVLGCSGSIAKDCRTTTFLIGDRILIDAGTGVGDLTLEEMRRIDHVFLTHSHLDHIACLPLMLDAVSSLRSMPVQVYALQHTINALQAHIFNNIVWPDFSALPSAKAPFLQYQPMSVGEVKVADGVEIEALSAQHTVPAVGFAARGERGWWVFSGDTDHNPPFWNRVNQMQVAALIIETTFGDEASALAQKSQHLVPQSLLNGLQMMATDRAPYPIYLSHSKPADRACIQRDIDQWTASPPAHASHLAQPQWLQIGQIFEI